MKEISVDIPCPVCKTIGEVAMMTHINEIPYFGEHTQVTVLCNSCGWRQTDFIPAEKKEPLSYSLKITDRTCLNARVIRSSSCTISIPELELEVNPGAESSGYVSNVEGVLIRFTNIVKLAKREAESENDNVALKILNSILVRLKNCISVESNETLTLNLHDPRGHSMIAHEDSIVRPLTDAEIAALPVGPEIPVMST